MINDTSFVRSCIAANVVLPLLATVAVALRFIARWGNGNKIKSDDWTALAALIPAIIICMSGIYAAYTGLRGAQLETITESDFMRYKKLVFADLLVCHFVYGLVKISLILFYKRIFDIKSFRRVANAMLAITSLWMVSAFFLFFFSARRVTTFWTTEALKEGTQYVIGFAALVTAMSIVDISLDLIILLLPLPVVRKLRLDRTRKIYLCMVFMLGAFCLLASIFRLYWSQRLFNYRGLKSRPRFEATDKNSLWGHVEACMSVVTCCLPIIYTFFKSSIPFRQKLSNVKAVIFGGRKVSQNGDRDVSRNSSQREILTDFPQGISKSERDVTTSYMNPNWNGYTYPSRQDFRSKPVTSEC